MSTSAHRLRRAAGIRRPAAVALAAALGAALLSGPAGAAGAAGAPADSLPGTTDAASAPAGDDGGAAARDTASREAARSGKRVEVLPLRSETAAVFANPSGTFTEERHAVPQRVRRDGRLLDIDTRLVAGRDGLAPRATAVGMRFSTGGDGPLAVIRRDGRSIEFSWPDSLPAPEVQDNTATYPEVLPGVDLKLSAGPDGFAQLLVVKSAKAAAHPRLRRVSMGMRTDGVSAEVDRHGNITAVDHAGQEVFHAPTPRMWDSSGAPGAEWRAKTASGAPASGRGVRSMPPESEFAPPPGARESAMPVTLTDDTLSLVPDRSLLTGEDTTYPVYIDPYVTGSRAAWTLAYKRYPNTAYFNGSGWGSGTTSEARVGYEGQTNHLGRSFFRMDSRNLWNTDKQIIKSTFRIRNTYSWSCTKRPVQLWQTGAISSSTTWNNQPTWSSKLDEVNDANGWSGSCPAGNIAFDATAAAKRAASGKQNSITFGLRAANESDTYGWKKFDAKSAVLSTEYNTPPKAPTALDTTPSTLVDGSCTPTSGQHVILGNTDVYLNAKITDPDGGTVKARFHLWATGKRHTEPGLLFDQTVSVTSGSIARVKVPRTLLAQHEDVSGGRFSWKAQAADDRATSDWTPPAGEPGCLFGFNAQRPSTPPAVTSPQYPDGTDGWPNETGTARTTGTFTLAPGDATGVERYEYWTDWDQKVRAVDAGPTGTATIQLTPMSTGPHRLFVRSLNAGGNRSDLTAYLFYADSPEAPDQPGDLNGDGNADLYGIRDNGELRLYAGRGDGTLGPADQVAPAGFGGSLITHRGDWTGDGFEDLIEHRRVAGETRDALIVHPNDGRGHLDEDRFELKVYEDENRHWEGAGGILAIGDVDGPLDTDGDGTPDVPGHPDLLVRKGGQLWLYFGAPSGYLDEHLEQPPVLIGNSGWDNYDLAAPGDVTGNGRVDLLARNRVNGNLYLYEGTGDRGEGLAVYGSRTQVATGWSPTERPLLTSGGDADNDGVPDLWATTADTGAGLVFHPALRRESLGAPQGVGTTGWQSFRALS
ncbi:VCBS repeat-containing protein [Streptomyces durbertensis]|uniref:VCBS repeat-containing protein n=1 Tax=Streptomyces durbertensis TaxID=2448886 RepID=A0ABR6EEI4_9ACTN|nr:FG-GAP-like repeat-containing protein [Streptomyces durbertensis]MBB1243751.1 VCBS repeat-containing protein [Streptomyces durbertensis]